LQNQSITQKVADNDTQPKAFPQMSEATKVLITVPFEEELLSTLQKKFPSLDVKLHPIVAGEDAPDEIWAEADVIYTFRHLPQAELAPNVRWIQFHNAGVDRHIDHPLLKRKDVQATNLSGANAPQVAEHALALMLALGHNLPAILADQSRNKWSARRAERFQPAELYGSTVGIVGFGSVGRHLARLLTSFNVTILASKRDLKNFEPPGYPPDDQQPDDELAHRLYPGRALRTLFKDSDYVVVTLPLTSETKGLIGEKQLSALKPTAFLVDVSRGGIIDQEALIASLSDEKLAGAALDVFEQEPLPADSPLWALPNVIVSPHVAGFSPHYQERAMALFIENLNRYLKGEELINKVHMELGY
jgi:phosphoglycerate dehydrogenase-like enzyme